MYFQIRDDYSNLVSADYTAQKGYCEDLTEGKFSYTVIHGISNNPTDRRLLNILKQRTMDNDLKRYAVDYLRLSGSFAYTEAKLAELLASIKQDLSNFPENPEFNAILCALSGEDKIDIPPPALRLSTDDIRVPEPGSI